METKSEQSGQKVSKIIRENIMRMKYQGDYKGRWIANLMIRDSLYKVVSFNSLERARLWAMKEAKLAVSNSALNKMDVTSGDVRVEIDERKIIGYEISSEELLKNSERVA